LLRNVKNAPAVVLQNVEAGNFLVPYRLTGNAGSVRKLMTKYSDVPMDFADACLVDMATTYQTGRILTLDNDFRFYRWGKNRPFELLLSPERG
jgi:predicted nucleic acid-binding protein